MLFQRVNRSDAETVFAIFYNVAGATITGNYPAVWDTSSPDGVAVTKPAATTLCLLVGIATADIADSAYGKFQVYGYRASGYITNTTDTIGSAGSPLMAVAAQWYLTPVAQTGTGWEGFIYLAEAFATATAGAVAAANKKVFIRCL